MFVATAIVSVLLAALLTASAVGKLTRQESIVQTAVRVGFSKDRLNQLAVLLLAGAAGLVAGLWWAPIGVAAAIGVIGFFVVAIVFHLRADDAANIPKPLAFAALAVAALVLRLLS